MRNGTNLATLYAESAQLNEDLVSLAKADILKETYKAENIYHSEDQINFQTGELFEGYGVMVNGLCSRLSPAYLSASARRARKKVKATISEAKPLVGEQYRFLTLTLPYLRTDFETVLKIKLRAEQLFKKRDIWKKNVSGAFFAEEIVIGDETRPISTHYHIHIHILMIGKWIDQWRLADLWTECVEKACAESGVECLMRNLKTNRFMVDVRDVRKYAKGKSISFDSAIEELCKYTTKGSEFEKVPKHEVIAIDKALHGREMIKSYGNFNNQQGKGKKDRGGKDTSLDTQCITDGKGLLQKIVRREMRQESLAETGARFIANGQRVEWLEYLNLIFENRRGFRVDQLIRKYPYATFRTLSGSRWFGVSKRPPLAKIHYLADIWQKQRETPKPTQTEMWERIVSDFDNKNLLTEIVEEFEKERWLVSLGIVDQRKPEASQKQVLKNVLDFTTHNLKSHKANA